MVVYLFTSIHSILFCKFLGEIKILEIFTTKTWGNGGKKENIHNLVWQILVPTYRCDIKIPKICVRKYF